MSDDDYGYSDLGIPIGAREQEDPTKGLPPWVMGSLAQQMHYEPQVGMWPGPQLKQLPSVGPAPLGDGGQFSAGNPTVNRAADVASDVAYQTTVPQSLTDLGLIAATGGGSVPYRMGALAASTLLDPEDAQAGKGRAGAAAKKLMGSVLNTGEEPTIAKLAGIKLSKGNKPGTGRTQQEPINAPYISDPVRVANPGVYKRPDVIAAEAAARVEPEHPALKELFGVTRQDLYDISQQGRRQGNMEPDLWQPSRPGKPNEAALAVMNPANEQRILDTLSEARKHPGLEQGMVPWYVMDPMYQRMVKLVGPERAAKEYRDFNMSVTPFSAGSSVPNEINRGTAANMMRQRGEYDLFQKYGGIARDKRGADFPPELRDVNGVMGHLNQANPVERYMKTGSHGYGDDQVKINLYSGASGVPETGFQTKGAVPDAHFTRAIGVPDARKNPNDFNDYMGGTEYRQIGPWYRDKIAKQLGIEAVPSQALMWGTYGPQTGVKTKIGAGKLELMSKQMWERAQKLGIDPHTFRDQVLRGEQHSELEDDSAGMGSLASLSRYG